MPQDPRSRDLQEIVLAPVTPPPPEGSRFKGFEEFTVRICALAHNTRYRSLCGAIQPGLWGYFLVFIF